MPIEGLKGRVVPNGPGPPTGGTGSPAQAAIAAYVGPVGDGSSQRPGPTSWGDGESCPGASRYLWRVCGGRPPPSARAHQMGGRGILPRRRSVPMEGLQVTAIFISPGPPAGGPGVLPRRRSVPMEGLRGTAVPNGRAH